MAISAESMMNMTQQQAQQAAEEELEQIVFTTESQRLMEKINESRRQGVNLSNPIINVITNRTVRVIKGLVTEKNQFRDRKRKIVKKGTAYHVHYTNDNEEVFMTSAEHNVFSKIIYPIDKQKTLIGYYNTLNQQEPIILKPKINPPNDADYGKGSFIRSKCFLSDKGM